MRSRLKSDNVFLSFWKSDKGKRGWLLLLALGVLLLIFGGRSTAGKAPGEETDAEAALCQEVETLCSSVRGVGKCRVMLTFARGETREYRGTAVVSVTPPQVCAAVIVCEGGDSPAVQKELTDLLCAAFDIGANRVRVYPMK